METTDFSDGIVASLGQKIATPGDFRDLPGISGENVKKSDRTGRALRPDQGEQQLRLDARFGIPRIVDGRLVDSGSAFCYYRLRVLWSVIG